MSRQSYSMNQIEAMTQFLKDCIDLPRLCNTLAYREPDALLFASLRDTLSQALSSESVMAILHDYGFSHDGIQQLTDCVEFLDAALLPSDQLQ